MADPLGSGNSDRDTDKVLVALKKGAQLLKYGRKGKPKFCPFRLSNDESTLIWLSSGGEKVLKLATVSKIVPGQRTAVFQRYLCREKEYLSFSLIYDSGKRSLDLICKDKVEAEVWFAGLKALIASGQCGRSKIDGWSEEGIHFDDSRDLSSNSFSDSSISTPRDISSPESSLHLNNLPKNSTEKLSALERSDATNMHVKGASSDVFRVSVSSVPSTSSHGSAPDDCDSLGDVYLWGEIINDTSGKLSDDKCGIPFSRRVDILLPRPLESNTVLDVQYVACGVRHAALITRQGEVFTWGEESGGRLGHGVGTNVTQPRLVESLAATTSDFVACGEFHTCAINFAGELYTWGDGSYHAGLLGHGNDVSHCIPRRVSGPLDGLQVAYVSCGVWHTALITSAGQLFTFGDGTFGVLGHGNRESAACPREVESLMGLKTVTVACGVWHTAAAVEVIATQANSTLSSGKLFTWGDGDKYRLGHGDKEARLKPTCVPSLIDYNFHRLACGHSLTVGLTISGRVFTMGSSVYGQLGNPHSDGKSPCSVEDKLAGECVGEIACGSYHVAVLTAKNEVYTWGKGANGRLGHGDIEDRKTPTLVEALKDRPVKHIMCGSNFTAAICQHKWVSGAEQSQCSSCRLTFGFTRKRHNCYNCGLVFCHSCSSKKAMRAALSPNPAKPYRVCDSCFLKLNKVLESSGVNNKKATSPYSSSENKDRYEKAEAKPIKSLGLSNLDLMMYLDTKAAKYGRRTESPNLVPGPQVYSLLQVKDVGFSSGPDMQRMGLKAGFSSATPSVSNSRAVSPFSRKASPQRSATPSSTTLGISFTKSAADNLKEANDNLNIEVQKLRAQVESLRKQCEQQEVEMQKSELKAQEAMALATDESAKSKAAKEVMKSLTAQLKDMAERLPSGVYDGDDSRPVYVSNGPNGIDSHIIHQSNLNGNTQLSVDPRIGSHIPSPTMSNQVEVSRDTLEANETSGPFQKQRTMNSDGREDNVATLYQNTYGRLPPGSRTETANLKGLEGFPSSENGLKSGILTSAANHQVETEWLEQYEPGVYITLMVLRDGTRDLKRVRFSRRKFGEHQAETWWSENREKVYKKYNIRPSDKSSAEPLTG